VTSMVALSGALKGVLELARILGVSPEIYIAGFDGLIHQRGAISAAD